MHASLDRDDGTPTMSVIFQSNEQFDGSTSISSESANTGSTPTVSRAYENISITRALVTVKRQEIEAAGGQLSDASRQRRLALLAQRERQAARVSMSEEDKTQALQSMLRIQDDDPRVNHVGKIDGSFAILADPGAMVSATSDRNVHRFVTPIDTTDTVKLHSFAGTKENMLCLGSTYEQIISKATDDSLTVNVFKTYVLFTDSTDINIMSTDDQVISGGSVIFGTNDRTAITQTVAGQEHQYELTGGGSFLISPLGGAIKLRKERKLHYLIEYTLDLGDQRRQQELEAIQTDVRFSYGVYSEEVRMKSYTIALEKAIGNKQQSFAVAALRSHASLPPFPPCLTHFDQYRDPNSEYSPVADLVDSFARAQIHAQKFGDDEHQLQRDELFQQIQCATQQLQDITPNLHGINSLHVTQVVSNHVTLDFRGMS